MGNHQLGNSIGREAQFCFERRLPGEKALDILDRLCKGRGGDAEWEAEDPDKPGHVHPLFGHWTDPHPKCGLGMLMVEAFSPGHSARDLPLYEKSMGYVPSDDPVVNAQLEKESADSYLLWEKIVYEPFKKRYGFW